MTQRITNTIKNFSGITLCFLLLLAIFSPKTNAQDAEDAVIYIDSTAQNISGFGGAFIHFWRPDMTDAEIETAFGNEEGQLGFTILRLGIDPNPNRWSENLHVAQKAYDMGAEVFASPWNAPSDMLKPGVSNDTVAVDKYDEYAAHLNDFNTYMEENGVDLHSVSIQNEPDYANDWTGWSVDGMLKFMRENAPSIDAPIMAPESFQFRRNFSDPLLNDSLASANLDIVGGHIYGGGLGRYELAEEKGKEIWMTEHYTTSDRSANIWPDALGVGTEIQQVMKANWNAYIWWYLVRYYGPIHDGVDADTDSYLDRASKGSVTKRGYVMAQFSKFVRPGFTRVHTQDPFGRSLIRVSTTAYKDSDGKLVIIVINGENGPRDIDVYLDDHKAETFLQYRTSELENVEQLEDVEVSGNVFSMSLPAKTITTLVSDNVVVSNEEFAAVPGEFQLEQNYPNPFNPSTVISYQLPVGSEMSLKVFDLLGREVATLVDGRMPAGAHQVEFNASGLSSGMYMYRLEANEGDISITKKLTLIK